MTRLQKKFIAMEALLDEADALKLTPGVALALKTLRLQVAASKMIYLWYGKKPRRG